MTTNEANGTEALPPPPDQADAKEPSTARGYSLATLMLAVTLVSLVLGLAVVAPGLAVAAVAITLPALARTAIVLRHTAPAGALAVKLATFGTSCCVSFVVAVAASVCGFATCMAVGYPAGMVFAVLSGLVSFNGYGVMIGGGVGTGAIAGCAIAVFIAYKLMLRRAWVPMPVESITRPERRLLLGVLLLTAIATIIGAMAMMWYYA